MQEHFFLKLMGMCLRCYLKMLMGYIVLRNIYPSASRLFEASKMSQNHFPLCSGSEVPWKLPQIFMSDKHWCTEVLLAASATKGDDALSHRCNPNLHPCAQDLKQAQQQQEPSLEKSQLCPQAPLSSAHLPVKTSEPRLISNGIHPPTPTSVSSHIRTCFCTHRVAGFISHQDYFFFQCIALVYRESTY